MLLDADSVKKETGKLYYDKIKNMRESNLKFFHLNLKNTVNPVSFFDTIGNNNKLRSHL